MKSFTKSVVTIEMTVEEAKKVLSLLTTHPNHDDNEESLVRKDLQNVLSAAIENSQPIAPGALVKKFPGPPYPLPTPEPL